MRMPPPASLLVVTTTSNFTIWWSTCFSCLHIPRSYVEQGFFLCCSNAIRDIQQRLCDKFLKLHRYITSRLPCTIPTASPARRRERAGKIKLPAVQAWGAVHSWRRLYITVKDLAGGRAGPPLALVRRAMVCTLRTITLLFLLKRYLFKLGLPERIVDAASRG